MTYFKNNVWIMEGSSGSVDIHDFNTVSSALVMYNTMLNYLDITTTMWSSFSSQLSTGSSDLQSSKVWKCNHNHLWEIWQFMIFILQNLKKIWILHIFGEIDLHLCLHAKIYVFTSSWKPARSPTIKILPWKYNKINRVIDLNETGQTLSRL